ncbi:MAG: NADH:flavin oxidoreductase, partial [Verrucomicrobia bacterium]|nr:NADH:flavin oxidoreductase [Verrucomicrobiota bacterium]
MASFIKIPALRTVEAFRNRLRELNLDLPCKDSIQTAPRSPLAQPVETLRINGKRIGNRWAVHPMEGWDGTPEGGAAETVFRRWKRFGRSGAKLIFGCEAMAVRFDGRANPRQLVIVERNKKDLAELLRALVAEHKERFGSADDLVVGFQLTHSGRFSRPEGRPAPRIAWRHPILD